MPERPAPSISASDGVEIRPLTDIDISLIRELHKSGDNAVIASVLDVDRPDFVAAVRAEPWSNPMVLLVDGEPLASAVIGAADTQNRHGRLIMMAHDPRLCRVALGLYVRHLFWSHPLHRLYAMLPAGLSQTNGYADLLHACGFVDEGSLVGHMTVGSQTTNLDVLGVLRPEFDAWCRDNQPAWVLDSG